MEIIRVEKNLLQLSLYKILFSKIIKHKSVSNKKEKKITKYLGM